MPRFTLLLVACLALTSSLAAQEPGLKVPPGFKVMLYADHTLANDIYAMTLDQWGNVLVTSRGWVKRLEDTDGDGKADHATTIFETATGGMGLCWDRDFKSLYFCGDGWFSRIEDLPPSKASIFKDDPLWMHFRARTTWTQKPRSAPDSSSDQLNSYLRFLGLSSTMSRKQWDDTNYFTNINGWDSRFARPFNEHNLLVWNGLDFSTSPPKPIQIVNKLQRDETWFFRWWSQKVAELTAPPHKPSVTQIYPLPFSEHGGHAMRKGPDGRWYIIAGNNAGLKDRAFAPTSPIRKPEAGGILRFSKDLKQVECIAQGFRNPYDFDFTSLGDIITYDSDTERDFLLPGYLPTRLYHVAHGQHHGWRVPGYMQALARPDYYADTVDVLAPMGRGSPTGLVCYRHYQFPTHYRDGMFVLDWTFGKIWFVPLKQDSSTYATKPELFLEPSGIDGFAPTDICVAPDGSLFVCIGGRRTRGAVYRIEYVGTATEPRTEHVEPLSSLTKVLTAPQPLEAWSRAQWEPLAREIPEWKFIAAIVDEKLPINQRVRAIEIINDLFSNDVLFGLPLQTAEKASKSPAMEVRARIAWSLGRDFPKDGEEVLVSLALDPHPRVRLAALDAIGDLLQREKFAGKPSKRIIAVIKENLGHEDKRVRMAARRIATLPSFNSWWELAAELERSTLRNRLELVLSNFRNGTQTWFYLHEKQRIALEGLNSEDSQLRLDALRLLVLIDGDWRLKNPSDEVSTAYSLQNPRSEIDDLDRRIRTRLRQLYPTGDKNFDREVARYFAMIEDDDPATIAKILARISKDSTATDDVHHLIVLSRLMGKPTPAQTALVVDALLGLDHKLQGQQLRGKLSWGSRLAEVVFNLMMHYPKMTDTMLKHPRFVNPAHIVYITPFATENRVKAARLYLDAVRKDGNFVWSPELVDLLAELPSNEYRPMFRKQWSDYSLRDAMLRHLVENPEESDRTRFLDGFDSSSRDILRGCINALQTLPRDPEPKNMVPILRRLRLSGVDPKEKKVREQLTALVLRQAGMDHPTVDATIAWLESQHPTVAKLLRGDDEDADHWKSVLAKAPWDKGSAERGLKVYRERSCIACHTGASRVEPDLTGAAGRLSRDDLFTAIIYPSRDVAPAYRVNEIETLDGKNFSGIVVFESAESLIVQLDAVKTVRIDTANVASRQPGRKSLMPTGLLKDLKPDDLADLYAYFKTLKAVP